MQYPYSVPFIKMYRVLNKHNKLYIIAAFRITMLQKRATVNKLSTFVKNIKFETHNEGL